ncbi:MAG: hypothetical protein KJO88_06565 [Gammaproteobacteria bacterium]|nr:hypothetical protein [Gammaproteobacteria bacterium]
MKKTALLLTFILTGIMLAACSKTHSDPDSEYTGTKASIEDFTPLINKEWSGTLTYLDYSGKNKRYTIPSKAKVDIRSNYKVAYQIEYPDEPHMNSTGKIRLSRDGTKLDKNIISRRELIPENSLVLVTEAMGKDNNQAAMIRTTYEISDSRFVIRNDFKTPESEKYINRNEYVFKSNN